MRYKIILNIPNEQHLTEILISEEKFNRLEPELQLKRLVKINGSYFNTSYIAKIIPDTEAGLLDKSERPALEQTTQTQSNKNNRQAVEELKKKLFKKNVL